MIYYFGPTQWIDYSCGPAFAYQEGQQMHQVIQETNSKQPILYDPCHPPYDTFPTVESVPGVVCVDVLEHIPEREIDDIMKEIFEIAQKFVYLNIAMYPAITILPNGENAHCTLKPKEWWNEKIVKHNHKQVYTSSVYDYANRQRLQIIFEKNK